MDRQLFEHPIIPVASETDAEATVEVVAPYLDGHRTHVKLVHVIEKAGGAPDKASIEQRRKHAETVFNAALKRLSELDVYVESEIIYGTDVATAIIDAAEETGASAIVFTPRGGSRWIKLLTGDVATSLMTESNVPVVTLPDVEETSG